MTLRDQRWGVVIDEQKSPVQAFTPRNSRNFQGKPVFPEQLHGVRVRFVNREGWRQDERVVYDDGFDESNATRIEGLELPGVTDPDLVWRHGRYFLAVARLRRETYTFEADLEHIVCQRGDVIRAAHDVPLWGVGWGRVRRLIGEVEGVELDETITMSAGQSYSVRFRHADGTSQLVSLETTPGEATTLTFATPLSVEDAPEVGDLALVQLTSIGEVILLVTAIEPQDDLGARIACVDEAPALFGPLETIPPFDSKITPPAGVDVPLVTGIRSDETVLQRGIDGVLRPRIVLSLFNDGSRPLTRIAGVHAQWRPAGSVHLWASINAPADASEVSIAEVESGESYDIRLRYLHRDASEHGDWTPVITHQVVGTTTPPPSVTNLSIEGRILRWEYPDEPLDHLGFRVRLISGHKTPNWAIGEPAHGGILTAQEIDLARTPPGDWTAMVKAVDIAGKESIVPASAQISLPEAIVENVLLEEDLDEAGFPGTITGGAVDGGTGDLVADDLAIYLPNPDALYLTDGTAAYLPSEADEMVWTVAVEIPAQAAAGDRIRLAHTIEGVFQIAYTPGDELHDAGYRPWPGVVDAQAILNADFSPDDIPDLEFWYSAADSSYASGVWEDLSGNGNDTTSGPDDPSLTTDDEGRSVLRFDGTDDAVLVGTPPDLSGGVTVFIAFRFRTPSSFRRIMAAGPASGAYNTDFFAFQYENAGDLELQLLTRSDEANIGVVKPVDREQKQYAVFTIGDADVALRELNNVLTDTTTDDPFGTPAAIALGAGLSNGAAFSFGAVDIYEVGLYSRVLSAEELDRLEAYISPRVLLRTTTAGGGEIGRISNFDVVFDPPDVVERLADVAIGSSGTRLPITKTFRNISVVGLTIIGSGEATARLVDKDEANGLMVHVLDFSGTQIAGTVDAVVQGY